MNILIVTQNYRPMIGGIAMQAELIAKELSKRHQVRVAAGNFKQCRLPSRLRVLHTNLLAHSYKSYQDGSIPVHALTPRGLDRVRLLPISMCCLPILRKTAYQRLKSFGYLSYRAVYLPRMQQLMQEVDLVHVMAGGYLAWTAQEAARCAGVPFICTPYVHPHQWGDSPADIRFLQRCHAVIALLQSDKHYLASLGVPESLIRIIGVVPFLPPTTDPAGFRARHHLESHPIVLYIGRMMVQKGAKAILDAAQRVWIHIPDARFVFIGPMNQATYDWFENVDPRILYLGKVNDQEKADALAACSLFCMPSMSEILPTVYLEAWNYGKAVIGGKAEGLPELVEGTGGGITTSQDAQEVSRAIVELLLDPEQRACMGERGQELVERCFTKEAVVGSLESLYQELCDRRKEIK